MRHMKEVNRKLSVIPMLSEDLDAIKPHINEYRKLKNRGVGLIIGIALAAGGVGASFLKFLQGFSSGH